MAKFWQRVRKTGMAIVVERIARYYDDHALEVEEMGQSDVHIRNIHYLFSVLKWLFRGQPVYVGSELNLYRTRDLKKSRSARTW